MHRGRSILPAVGHQEPRGTTTEADEQGLAVTTAAGYPLASTAFTWEVRANDRNYHAQFRRKSAFCLSKRKYAVSTVPAS